MDSTPMGGTACKFRPHIVLNGTHFVHFLTCMKTLTKWGRSFSRVGRIKTCFGGDKAVVNNEATGHIRKHKLTVHAGNLDMVGHGDCHRGGLHPNTITETDAGDHARDQ